MKSDSDIKRDVEAELKWSPDLDETDIAVKVNTGEVTLSGYARNYYEKLQAEAAVKRVKGVKLHAQRSLPSSLHCRRAGRPSSLLCKRDGSRSRGLWSGTINASRPRTPYAP